jgi:hypothetical protein
MNATSAFTLQPFGLSAITAKVAGFSDANYKVPII